MYNVLKKLDRVTWFFIGHDPYSHMTYIRDIIKSNILVKLHKIEGKLCPREGEQGFKEIRPSDLVFLTNMTNIQTCPRLYQERYSGICFQD